VSYVQGAKPNVVCETFPGGKGPLIECYRFFAGRGRERRLRGQTDGGENAQKQ